MDQDSKSQVQVFLFHDLRNSGYQITPLANIASHRKISPLFCNKTLSYELMKSWVKWNHQAENPTMQGLRFTTQHALAKMGSLAVHDGWQIVNPA